jgi:hypothetical protein
MQAVVPSKSLSLIRKSKRAVNRARIFSSVRFTGYRAANVNGDASKNFKG